ncbi:MAG: hypothetical protein HY866_21710 [Chloroflexi bacterium]|nr:hypothetical protein [Chloroflexota bacterium]
MAREPLDRLLENVSDEELESLRDAILREEGRRRARFQLVITPPFPPLKTSDEHEESTVTRWAKLITWLAKDAGYGPATSKRGVMLRITYALDKPDGNVATILLHEALIEAGLLIGRTPEWMDATITELEPGEQDTVSIQMWDKPASAGLWT